MKLNRKHFTFAAMCAATAIFLPTSAFAGEVYYRSVSSQPYNIARGISRQEQRNIQQIQTRLEATKRQALRDGRINPQERQQINNLQRQLDQAIRNAKRN